MSVAEPVAWNGTAVFTTEVSVDGEVGVDVSGTDDGVEDDVGCVVGVARGLLAGLAVGCVVTGTLVTGLIRSESLRCARTTAPTPATITTSDAATASQRRLGTGLRGVSTGDVAALISIGSIDSASDRDHARSWSATSRMGSHPQVLTKAFEPSRSVCPHRRQR